MVNLSGQLLYLPPPVVRSRQLEGGWICWWKKSGIRWEVVYHPIIYIFCLIPGGCLGFLPSQGLHGCVISSFAMGFVSKWYPKSMSTFKTTWSFPRSLRSRRFLKGKHWRRMEFPSILKNTIGICAAVPFIYCWDSVYIYRFYVYIYIYTTHIYICIYTLYHLKIMKKLLNITRLKSPFRI